MRSRWACLSREVTWEEACSERPALCSHSCPFSVISQFCRLKCIWVEVTETTSQAALPEGLTHDLPLPPTVPQPRMSLQGCAPFHICNKSRCSQSLCGPSWEMKKAWFLFLASALPSGIWWYSYLARNHRNKNNLMKPRESEFLHGRRLNATGCAETHPEQTLGLWASAQFCHRVTHASDASPANGGPWLLYLRTQNSLKIPKCGKCGSHFFSQNTVSGKRCVTRTDDPDASEMVREHGFAALTRNQTELNNGVSLLPRGGWWSRGSTGWKKRGERKDVWGPHSPHFMVDRGPCMQSPARCPPPPPHAHVSFPPLSMLGWKPAILKPVEITSCWHVVWNGGYSG